MFTAKGRFVAQQQGGLLSEPKTLSIKITLGYSWKTDIFLLNFNILVHGDAHKTYKLSSIIIRYFFWCPPKWRISVSDTSTFIHVSIYSLLGPPKPSDNQEYKVRAMVGRRATFTMQIYTIPRPTYVWTRNGKETRGVQTDDDQYTQLEINDIDIRYLAEKYIH